jgi:hypothetical protein
MNNQQKYLAWLRTSAPEVYVAAIRKVAHAPRNLGGLSDDLVARMYSPSTGFGFLSDEMSDLSARLRSLGALGQDDSDPDNIGEVVVTGSTPTVDTSSLVVDPTSLVPADILGIQEQATLPTAPINLPADTTTPAASSSNTGLFSSIVAAVGSIGAAAMTSSAQSNLLKLNTQRAAAGLPPVNANGVPVATSLSSNPQIAAMESSIAGVASSPVFWIAGLALLAYIVLRK